MFLKSVEKDLAYQFEQHYNYNNELLDDQYEEEMYDDDI